MIFEDVGHGDKVDVFIASEQIYDGLRAAAAATYKAGFKPVLL